MKKICLIFGGKSSEHEVSLRSASAILSGIDTSKYEVLLLGITKDGKWYLFEGDSAKIKDGSWILDSENLTAASLSQTPRTFGACRYSLCRPRQSCLGSLHGQERNQVYFKRGWYSSG